MKILLFTHENDIDGMGSIIICKKAFENFDFVTCKTYEVNKKVKEKIDDKTIYNYDFIFVTDICIKEPLLKLIANDKVLSKKIVVLDHHKSEIEEGNNKYDFVNIVVSNDMGKVSGTSLFYNYLIDKGYITHTSFLDEFVECTRQYDTWEWIRYNNVKGRMLHILFETLGYEKYIFLMTKKLENDDYLKFTSDEIKIIEEFDKRFKQDVENILVNMKVYNLLIDSVEYKIGYVKCPYKYRNDIDGIVRKNNVYDIDTVGMIMTDEDTVSYRSVKDIDVSKIGLYFGGKGHRSAAGNPKDNDKFKEVLKKLEM